MGSGGLWEATDSIWEAVVLLMRRNLNPKNPKNPKTLKPAWENQKP
jgi:hypothetical protein